jgi:hypothetical protein
VSADFLGIHKRADMDQLIARAASTSHVGHVELLRAARDGIINLAFLDRHAEHAHQWGDALCKCGIKTVGLLPRIGAHPVSPAKGDIQ